MIKDKKISKSLNYSSAVNYKQIDYLKILMQKEASSTIKKVRAKEFKEIQGSRGETAYVFKIGKLHLAFVQEGLGTKSLITEDMYRLTGRSYYKEIAQDAVATIVNDVVVIGAEPLVVNAYWSVNSYSWFNDKVRARDLILGWSRACKEAEVAWGGGETQSLNDIVKKDTIELAGSAIGIVDKTNLVSGKKIKAGDSILLIESSGIHTNGLSLTRSIAQRLRGGYKTKLPEGTSYGEMLLKPSYIYSKLIKDLFNKGVDLHYIVHITGHGWRKLMRADRNLSYIIENIPRPHALFDFIQTYSKNTDREMYGTFNMGAGLAIFIPKNQVRRAQEIAEKHKLKTTIAGYIDKGPRRVVIKPKSITFEADSLQVR